MKRQRILVWTGGNDRLTQQCQPMANALPDFPDPVPLSRAALIRYVWGNTTFDIFATAASLRTTPWGEEEVTWLHCKGMQVGNINPEGPTSMMVVLIPAHFITHMETGVSYEIRKRRNTEDLGVFPPHKAAPNDALSLSEVERVLAQLQTTQRN